LLLGAAFSRITTQSPPTTRMGVSSGNIVLPKQLVTPTEAARHETLFGKWYNRRSFVKRPTDANSTRWPWRDE
jgi:hypothetical protein